MALEAMNSPTTANPFYNEDAENLQFHEPWIKRKRSKRPRLEQPPSEEEYLALCLIMLARGGGGAGRSGGSDNSTKTPSAATNDGGVSRLLPPQPPALKLSYKCSVCNKAFPSYQALGGHKASHRKSPLKSHRRAMSFSQLLQRAFSTTTQASCAAATNNSLFTVVYKERNLKRLVEKFKKSSEAYRFRTKSGIYEDTVRRLASAKRFKWIEEILEDQKKYSDISKEGFAVRLISLYGKSGMFDNAQKVFDEMPERNCERTLLSFNALLAACVNSRKFDKVDGVFRDLPEKLAIEPDLVSYNTVIKAFCGMDSLDSAVSVLDEMKTKGLKPDVISFNTLLNAFYGKGRFADGERIWDLMEKNYVSPDIRSYNAKLLGLFKDKKTKEVVDLIGEMKAKGIEPDVFSFNLVIESFVKSENLEEAKQWYNEMKKCECVPNKTTFEKLIPFLRKQGDLEFAFELCEEVFKRRFLLDVALLQRVVEELAKASKIEEAKKLVELGKTNDYRRYRLKLPELPSESEVPSDK